MMAGMTDHAYKVSELVGTSTQGIDHAISNAIERAGRTVRHLDWFEVTQIRGWIKDGTSVGHVQVTMKVGFRLDDED
jgi:flavin-binding protein dodecin